jgi:hypothetical protein
MALYSLQGELPKPLPARVRLSNGFTRTNPSTYTAKELDQWGYQGPIELPAWNPATEAIEWSGDDLSYLVRPLTTEELEERLMTGLRQAVNYRAFYDALLTSSVYQAIRAKAVESLALTVACTEFIAAISDAKFGTPNEAALQACIDNIVGAAALDGEQLLALEALMAATGLSGLYTVPDITD